MQSKSTKVQLSFYRVLFVSFTVVSLQISCKTETDSNLSKAELLKSTMLDTGQCLMYPRDTTANAVADTLFQGEFDQEGKCYVVYPDWRYIDLVGDNKKEDAIVEYRDPRVESNDTIEPIAKLSGMALFERGKKSFIPLPCEPYNTIDLYRIKNRIYPYLMVAGNGGGSSQFGSVHFYGYDPKKRFRQFFAHEEAFVVSDSLPKIYTYSSNVDGPITNTLRFKADTILMVARRPIKR